MAPLLHSIGRPAAGPPDRDRSKEARSTSDERGALKVTLAINVAYFLGKFPQNRELIRDFFRFRLGLNAPEMRTIEPSIVVNIQQKYD
jgi:hypothetical protein